jgi:Bacteriocin-protection, YdeI or OmpD-Associated/Domain of unknown function (DUF1905)
MEKLYEFDAVIQNGGEKWPEAACVLFPYDVKEAFGTKGQVKINATFDGIPYRGSLANMGLGHMVILRKDIKAQVGKNHGDTVSVTIQKDTAERIVEVPQELKAALELNPDAATFYNSLSYTNRKEYARWIATAKRQETKDNRLKKTLEMLLNGVKHP